MNSDIGVGLIVGLVSASSLYVWNSNNFTKTQKIFLLIFLVFPPLQWLSILLVLGYNKYKTENSVEHKSMKKASESKNKLEIAKENLHDLKRSGIINHNEYSEKIDKIDNEIYNYDLLNTNEYKQLKHLFDSNILTKDEFESKVEILKAKVSHKKPINKSYRIVDGYSEGLALVINDDLDYGYIDSEGKLVIDFIFEHAENFQNGKAKVRLNGVFKDIDYNGDTV